MHYICTGGCKGVSSVPGVCGAEGCTKHNHPLVECNCTDGNHTEIMQKCEKCNGICSKDGTCMS